MKPICKDSRGQNVYSGDMIGWPCPLNGPSFDKVDDLDPGQLKEVPKSGVKV